MTHAMKLDCPFCKGKHTTDLQLANCPVLVAAFGRVKVGAGEAAVVVFPVRVPNWDGMPLVQRI